MRDLLCRTFAWVRCGGIALASCAALLGAPRTAGDDWPSWRGPTRDGISAEQGWTWQWGDTGPTIRWKASVGTGFSSFAVVKGRAYTLGNSERTDTVNCLDTATGKVLWQHSYTCDPQPLSYEGGPSSTPAVHGQRVFTFSKEGHLFCLDAASGKVQWSRQFPLWPWQEGDWRNTWRYAGSPLVLEDRVVISVGRAGTCLRVADGSVLWESEAGHPGYSSPVPFAGRSGKALAFFAGHEVVGVDAVSGRSLWTVPWKTLWDLNAADPVFMGSRMFISSGNGVGCALFDLGAEAPQELWRNKNLKTVFNSAVAWRGAIFGFNDNRFTCLDATSGEERWSTREVRHGSLILAGGKLILLSETGLLVVAEPDAAEYRPLAKAQILEGRCWTTPVLSDGLLLARNATGNVVCLDLRPAVRR